MPFPAQDPPGIPSISSVVFGWSDEDNTSRASCARGDDAVLITGCIILFPDDPEFFLSLLAGDDLVYPLEGLEESLVVFLLFVQL